MRSDIYGALKNALERGENIEQAIQSLINSGYGDIEVRQAASQLTAGVMSTVTPNVTPGQTTPMQSSFPSTPSANSPQQFKPLTRSFQTPQQQQQVIQRQVPRRGIGKIILLIIILIILLGALVATIFFRTEIIDYLSTLL